MVAHGCREGQRETLPLGRTQGTQVCEALLGLEATGFDGRTAGQEWAFRVAYQLDEDVPLPSTAAANTTPDLLPCLREGTGLARELGGPGAPLRGDVSNEGERFLGAVYRVVASVTRGLPGSLGKVSMTRGAGLTSPSSMAAAAGMALRSSIRTSSMRPRNAQRVSGRTKWAGAGLP